MGAGRTDMKSGVAAFAAAAVDFVRQTPPDGAVILAITGDEEADALDGTVALLDWMAPHGERMTHCLVGEPTCPNEMGEMMKIGRRGSMTCYFTAVGVQGHSAYPHRAKNPMSALVALMARLEAEPLDAGTAHFDASTLGDHHHRLRQQGDECDPGEGAGHGEHPVQRCAFRGVFDGMAAGPCRRRCRPRRVWRFRCG